jgi:stearoyl-CoA desaturase (delta-9 desaturase)
MRDHRVIRSRHLHKLQRRHFIIFDILPFVGTLVALGLLFYRPIGAVDISLFFAMWLLTGFGLTVGYHRLFTHRAFSTGTGVSCALIILGSMAGRGSMLSWVSRCIGGTTNSPTMKAIFIRPTCTAPRCSGA